MAHKIGIGITTTLNRKKHLDICLSHIQKFAPDSIVFINTDEGQGIAESKNNCLRALKDCDYIFLFDDDCFPIKQGWAEFFIDASIRSGNHHFLYLNHIHNKISIDAGIESYIDCGGCFMFLTKEVIEKVGAYGKYKRYGYEHAGYSQRIFNANLNPSGRFIMPSGASEFIFAFDMDVNTYGIDHKPSLPFCQAINSVKENEPLYVEDVKKVYKPL